MAQAARRHTDPHLAALWFLDVHVVDDRQRPTGRLQQGCTHDALLRPLGYGRSWIVHSCQCFGPWPFETGGGAWMSDMASAYEPMTAVCACQEGERSETECHRLRTSRA